MPGHTQLTRIPSRAYSTAATFASWITAAFVAQYGAACDHAVRPATEAVRMIDPDCCVRMTGTAARMPLTAPSTLTRNARSQSSVARLWMRPFGASTPALLISTSSRPKRSTARRDDGFDLARSRSRRPATVSTAPRRVGQAGRRSRRATVALTSLSTTSVSGSPANWPGQRGAERPARPGDRDDASRRSLIRAGTRRRR